MSPASRLPIPPWRIPASVPPRDIRPPHNPTPATPQQHPPPIPRLSSRRPLTWSRRERGSLYSWRWSAPTSRLQRETHRHEHRITPCGFPSALALGRPRIRDISTPRLRVSRFAGIAPAPHGAPASLSRLDRLGRPEALVGAWVGPLEPVAAPSLAWGLALASSALGRGARLVRAGKRPSPLGSRDPRYGAPGGAPAFSWWHIRWHIDLCWQATACFMCTQSTAYRVVFYSGG